MFFVQLLSGFTLPIVSIFAASGGIGVSSQSIVGVALLKNEEYFAAWSLMNAAPFCDRMIVMDNCSVDRTRRIVEAIAARHSHIEIIDVETPWNTHQYLEKFAGSRTWIFAVDGDEIYDPDGLQEFRERLLSGDYDRHWRVSGHTVNAVAVNVDCRTAHGFTPPAADSICKLYNFALIDSWHSNDQRLHEGQIVFKPHAAEAHIQLWKKTAWNYSALRCLHLGFFPRSSLDRHDMDMDFGRPNPAMVRRTRTMRQRVKRAIGRLLNPNATKYQHHRKGRLAQGPLRMFSIEGFGTPSDFRELDPDCDEALAVLHQSCERHL